MHDLNASGDSELKIGSLFSGYGGLDLAAPLGTPIHSATDGVVINAGPASGYGNWIQVRADDGTVTMYLVDTLYGKKDPIIRAYAKAFPGLYKTEIPDSLSRHFRYTELMFKVQTTAWGRYHQSDPSAFFNRLRVCSLHRPRRFSASTK